MKRVLQSCFDPLPRFMSMKSLAAVVALLVIGTAISVVEYLESSRSLVRHAPPDRGTCHAAETSEPGRAEEPALSGRCSREASAPSTSSLAPSRAWSPAPANAASRDASVCAPVETVTAPPFAFDPAATSTGG